MPHKIFCFFIFFFFYFGHISKAQNFSQFGAKYFFIEHVIHPSLMINKDDFGIYANLVQRAWGLGEDTPAAYNISLTHLHRDNTAIGFSAFFQEFGVFRVSRTLVNFSYRLKIGLNTSLYAGLAAGFYFDKADTSDIESQKQSEFADFNERKSLFDGDAGISLIRPTWDLSLSIVNLKNFSTNQVAPGQRNLFNITFRKHYYLGFEERYMISPIAHVEILQKTVNNITTPNSFEYSVDLGARISFYERFSFAAVYRAFSKSIVIAISFKKRNIGIFTDYQQWFGRFGSDVGGTFELGLFLKFNYDLPKPETPDKS